MDVTVRNTPRLQVSERSDYRCGDVPQLSLLICRSLFSATSLDVLLEIPSCESSSKEEESLVKQSVKEATVLAEWLVTRSSS